MFHPGRVMEVLSPKSRNVHSSNESTQVMLSMWDGNVFTFDVHPEISDKVSTDDIVLVDYSPISTNTPVPKRLVTKILKGSSAKRIWDNYKAFYEKKKSMTTKNQKMMQMPKPSAEDHSYMG